MPGCPQPEAGKPEYDDLGGWPDDSPAKAGTGRREQEPDDHASRRCANGKRDAGGVVAPDRQRSQREKLVNEDKRKHGPPECLHHCMVIPRVWRTLC